MRKIIDEVEEGWNNTKIFYQLKIEINNIPFKTQKPKYRFAIVTINKIPSIFFVQWRLSKRLNFFFFKKHANVMEWIDDNLFSIMESFYISRLEN